MASSDKIGLLVNIKSKKLFKKKISKDIKKQKSKTIIIQNMSLKLKLIKELDKPDLILVVNQKNINFFRSIEIENQSSIVSVKKILEEKNYKLNQNIVDNTALLNSLIEELNCIEKIEQNKISSSSTRDLDLNSSILKNIKDGSVLLSEEPTQVTTSVPSGMDLNSSILTDSINDFVPITSNINSSVSSQIDSAVDLDIQQQKQTSKNNVVASSFKTPIESLNCALNSNNILTQTTLDLTSLNQIKLNSIIGIFKSQGSLNNKRIYISYNQDEYCFYNYDKNNRKSSIKKENIDKNIRFNNGINLDIFKNKIYSTLPKIEKKINQMENSGFNSTQSIETQASVISSNKLKINTVEKNQVPVKEASGYSSISTNRTRNHVDSTSKNNLVEKKKHTISETDEPKSQNKVMACHIDDQNS
jgi:hypothetical protein